MTVHNPNAVKHPDCAACKQDWPIHTDELGQNHHIDLFATKEYGVIVKCPTPVWPEDEEEEEDALSKTNPPR